MNFISLHSVLPYDNITEKWSRIKQDRLQATLTVYFFNFSDSFFNEQFNLESENRFDLLARGHETKSTETLNSKNSFISGLKFSSININSIRGKKLELLAFIDFHQSQILAIQETKIDNSILTSELFPESFPYSVYRKDRTLMVVVLCFLYTRTSHTCPSQNWTMTQSQFGSNFL